MKQLLLSLFTLYVCATSIAQDTVTVAQDDIFGLRIGMPVSEQEIVNLFSERYNAQVDVPSREPSLVYPSRTSRIWALTGIMFSFM